MMSKRGVDPDDGGVYTFAELQAKFKAEGFTCDEIREHWMHDCQKASAEQLAQPGDPSTSSDYVEPMDEEDAEIALELKDEFEEQLRSELDDKAVSVFDHIDFDALAIPQDRPWRKLNTSKAPRTCEVLGGGSRSNTRRTLEKLANKGRGTKHLVNTEFR